MGHETKDCWPEIVRTDIRNWNTPDDIKVEKGTITPPEGGWENEEWYAVDVAFAATNPIHEGIYYTGLGGDTYAYVITDDGETHKPSELYYMKGIRKLNIRG